MSIKTTEYKDLLSIIFFDVNDLIKEKCSVGLKGSISIVLNILTDYDPQALFDNSSVYLSENKSLIESRNLDAIIQIPSLERLPQNELCELKSLLDPLNSSGKLDEVWENIETLLIIIES